MRVLITGANGYIGSGIVKKMYELGVEVIATDFSLEYVQQDVIKQEANIFEIDDPYTFFHKPDVLLHLAWRDGFKHDSKNHINDLPKHYDFIEKLVNGGVKKVCVLGSMHEIGFFEGCINANTPCRPQSLYGIAKNALRDAVMLLAHKKNINFEWLRGYYIVGNTHHGCSIFSKITQAEERGDKKFPFTTGKNQYDFIDYDIFCNQIAIATIQNDVFGIIECCSGTPEKLADRVERFIQENKYNIKLEYGTFPDRPYDSKAVWGDSKLIEKIMKGNIY